MTPRTGNALLFGLLLISTGALGCGSGCDGRARTDGDQGNLRFFYTSADGSTDFDRPIASGSSILLEIEPVAERQLDRLTNAEASPSSILSAQIQSPVEPLVRITGLQPGRARLAVQAQGGGESYTDSTSFHVDDVSQVELKHRCTHDASAAYVIDEHLSLDFTRFNHSGQQLAGTARSNSDALRTCQIFSDPDFYQDKLRCDEAGLHLDREFTDVIEDIWIDVANDISTAHASHRELGIQMIDPGNVDFEQPNTDLRVAQSTSIELLPYAYDTGLPVCSHLAMRIFIDTPNVCSGPNNSREFNVLPKDFNTFELQGLRRGTCEFAVVLQQAPGIEFLFDAPVSE